ncbi:hypothetical protein BTZ20_4477 [Rhodococcus sp. MTM3W5.2]|uniref:hypothetical protein n=1 Tax=Rhodococcus sp. MTM3W5.2 TaxID=1805827 RepID=UPI000979839A|nr:hypothetical protein [Rhodococcus sp. MTM3W5.2]AQA23633.1 hypothetical protein BTZ20_4477 [Rhodococcus sp. MTM3W5.2]
MAATLHASTRSADSMDHYADQFIRMVQEAPEPVRRSVIAHLRLCAGLDSAEVR